MRTRVDELIEAFVVADKALKTAQALAGGATMEVRATATRRGAVLIELRVALAAAGIDAKELTL